MRKLLLIISCLLTTWTYALTVSDSVQIQLLTCTQGEQVWSKYGHTAIRILDTVEHTDIVFNYGIFDLMADDFYIKFLRGETYYQLGVSNYAQFEYFYGSIGRTIYWQELNLTPAQKHQIIDALLLNYQPQNRHYLYNFVFDNCATRPYYLIKQALGDTILSDYKGYLDTPFRTAISHYTGPHSWVDFGINLIFGNEADQPMSNEQRLFLPEELMNYMAQARLSDGTPLVKAQHIDAFPAETVAWYDNAWLGIALFAILMLLLSLYDRHRQRIAWGVDIALIIVYLLLIAIVVFMAFFSCHPLIGFNWRLIILPIIHLCARLVYFVHR